MRKLLPLLIGIALGSFSSLAAADDLAQVYNQAKENDPQLLRAAAIKDAAFEAVNSSQSSLLPQINLTAGYNMTRSNYNPNEQNVLNAISLELRLEEAELARLKARIAAQAKAEHSECPSSGPKWHLPL